ncbi:hypothetical protein PV08_04841 [Exophiala spinifera]|uniref:Uncharacterized protein n=1 Tax=Exophiala spinifera TaxID=91928 RepID=A0A0D1YQZ0_9EURO|nr:uncharacterized protein PV08_04841 [Exophiala spinifera]KIW17646.1 hypothetical protein PV08_04841 [Exophiala spinifera]
MPLDKQTKANSSKPLTPTLSSNFRNVKTPLTPRLPGSTSSSPALSSRKEPFVRARSPGKVDQTATPLNNNVTPRSGARKSRFGTESPSTPVPVRESNNGFQGTPSQRPEAPRALRSHTQGLGISSPRLTASTPSLPKVGPPVVTVHRRVSGAKSMVDNNKDNSSKFFHADEAKSAVGSSRFDEGSRFSPARAQFFVGSSAYPSNMPSQVPQESPKNDLDEKFFRANDVHQLPAAKPPTPVLAATVQGLDTRHAANAISPPQSPKRSYKMSQPSSPRKIQLGPTPSPPGPLHTPIERPNSTAGGAVANTIDSPLVHRKSISASSATMTIENRTEGIRTQPPQPLDLGIMPGLSPRISGNNTLSPEALSPRSFSLASSNTIPTSVTSDTDGSEVVKPTSRPVSTGDMAIDQVTSPVQPQHDAASNARRERKVLDLEISNSSLLAINKTLERELRKQNGELRRYRRLSRSGRLSLATVRTASGQSAFSLDTVAEDGVEAEQMSELEDESDFDDMDDEDDSLISDGSGSLTNASARSRQRAKDEKRLMQDLSRHQQLLAESQQLSSTIKRCTTMTEELIRAGNKALDYRVGIGDVKLGGRVLNDEELDERGFATGSEEPEARQGLLSPGLAKAKLEETPFRTDEALPTLGTAQSGIASLEEVTALLESFSPVLRGE